MSRWPRLSWRVNPIVWERFVRSVESNSDDNEPYIRREVRRAIREYLDRDEYAEIEERVDRLVQAAGRTPADRAEKKSTSAVLSWDGEGHPVHTRVPPEDRDGLTAAAKEHDLTKGEVLTRALYEYASGGRAGRLADKLDRIEDDAVAFLEEVNESGSGMGTIEQRKRAICQRVKNKCPNLKMDRNLIEQEINKQGIESTKTVNEYLDRVTEYFEVVPHPDNPDLFIPKDEAAEKADTSPDAPAFERKPVEALDSDEKIQAARVVLKRAAEKSRNGKRRLTIKEVNQRAFDGLIKPSTARDMAKRVADVDGIKVSNHPDPDKGKCFTINLNRTSGLEAPAPDPSASSDTATTATATDGGTDPDDIEDEFDRLDAATPTG